jgi:hypothetical protein
MQSAALQIWRFTGSVKTKSGESVFSQVFLKLFLRAEILILEDKNVC